MRVVRVLKNLADCASGESGVCPGSNIAEYEIKCIFESAKKTRKEELKTITPHFLIQNTSARSKIT